MVKVKTISSRQEGLVMVEFAIIGLVFFIILFSVFEFARLLFVWNAVADATRLGARAAAVCIIDRNDTDEIENIARWDPTGSGASPILPINIDESNIRVRYLDENGVEVINPDPAVYETFIQIRYVEVSVIDYQHELLIPGFNIPVTLPPFTTTRPREALGIIPVDGVADATNQGC